MDVFALDSLGSGVGYVVKYLTKVHRVLLQEECDDKMVLTLAMMWIFRKRAFSISSGFKDLVDVQTVDENGVVVGQVDLEGKPIYKWYLVGFWASDLGVWSKKISYREFWLICSSPQFTFNVKL